MDIDNNDDDEEEKCEDEDENGDEDVSISNFPICPLFSDKILLNSSDVAVDSKFV